MDGKGGIFEWNEGENTSALLATITNAYATCK